MDIYGIIIFDFFWKVYIYSVKESIIELIINVR